MLYKTFPVILGGHEADDEQALAYARGLDWSELEPEVQDIRSWHCDHIGTIEGVDVYYNFRADYYFFTDEVETNTTACIEYSQHWQTQARGTNDAEYQIYLDLADDGMGMDITTDKPLKTYDEWLNS